MFNKLKSDYANGDTYVTVENDATQMESFAYSVGYGLEGLPQDYQLYVDGGNLSGAIGDCGTSTVGSECSAVPNLFTTLQSDIDAYS